MNVKFVNKVTIWMIRKTVTNILIRKYKTVFSIKMPKAVKHVDKISTF